LKNFKKLAVSGAYTTIVKGSAENWIKKQNREDNIFITDKNIFRLYRNLFTQNPTVVIGLGEGNKNFETVENIYQQLFEFEADRATTITGIGGGIVCDVTGFTASTYMRGLRFNFVPTSLLAQVDACIGGKNGFNLLGYKNIIGTFSHPELVLLDFSLLKTLPQEEIVSGTAEIVKSAVIGSPHLFSYLEKKSSRLCAFENDVTDQAVSESIKIKSKVVNADEKEKGMRRILNFGHTFGHAIENVYGFSHGKAVSLGMVIAIKISMSRGLLAESEASRILSLFKKLNLPTHFPLKKGALLRAIRGDKKRQGDSIYFVYLSGLGEPRVEKVSYKKLEGNFHDLCESE
jgi:3-dehydroquinate synthase